MYLSEFAQFQLGLRKLIDFMKYNPDIHHRRSIRLKGYDYTQPGAYFVTVCTVNRRCLFGEVVNGEMRMNDVGIMVERWWQELNRKFPHIRTDEFVVMPNHIYGIIVIEPIGADLCVCPDQKMGGHTDQKTGERTGATLPEIVQWFKTMTTNEYIRGVKQSNWPPFPGRLWQRNYFEHVIRNEESLNRIRQYIADNPARWVQDRDNPDAFNPEEDYLWLP